MFSARVMHLGYGNMVGGELSVRFVRHLEAWNRVAASTVMEMLPSDIGQWDILHILVSRAIRVNEIQLEKTGGRSDLSE